MQMTILREIILLNTDCYVDDRYTRTCRYTKGQVYVNSWNNLSDKKVLEV